MIIRLLLAANSSQAMVSLKKMKKQLGVALASGDDAEVHALCKAIAGAKDTTATSSEGDNTSSDSDPHAALRKKLASAELTASEWNIYVSCLCMEGFMVRKWTGNATNSRNVGSLPVRAC